MACRPQARGPQACGNQKDQLTGMKAQPASQSEDRSAGGVQLGERRRVSPKLADWPLPLIPGDLRAKPGKGVAGSPGHESAFSLGQPGVSPAQLSFLFPSPCLSVWSSW